MKLHFKDKTLVYGDYPLSELLPDHETETPNQFAPYNQAEFSNWIQAGQ